MRTILATLALAGALLCASMPARADADIIAQASRFLGMNPTGWAHNWCAYGLNRFVLAPLGLRTGTPSVSSFFAFPRTSPHRGALVIQGRGGRAAHIGIVEGVSAAGVQIISFNWGHRVARGTLRPSQVLAFVEPVAGRGRVARQAAAVPWPVAFSPRRHVVHMVSYRHHHHRHARHRRHWRRA